MTATALRAHVDARVHTELDLEQTVRTLANRVPFRGPDAPRGSEKARLTGQLPHWLRGDLVRVAPWFGATPRWAPAHWFDALGVVYGFDLRDGAVSLRWSSLDCDWSAAAQRGKVPLSSFASPNQRGALARLLQPVPRVTDNTNVNIVRMGHDLVALTEGRKQHLLDPQTLQVRGLVAYEDTLGDMLMLAHPISTGDRLTNLGIRWAAKAEVVLFDYPQHGRKRVARGVWATNQVPYIHSFGLTSKTAIILDHPLRVKPTQLLWSNRGYIHHFDWNPSNPARLILMNLADGKVSKHETDPFFCFHTVQAFETPDATVLDVVAYDDAEVVQQFMVDRLVSGLPRFPMHFVRFSVDRSTGRVSRRELAELAPEFPQIDTEFVGEAPARVIFGISLEAEGAHATSTAIRIDLETDSAVTFSDPSYVFGEGLFVGKPGRTREGDGVLLSVGASERGAALLVLDATTLELIARAEVDVHLPLGFHGTYVPA